MADWKTQYLSALEARDEVEKAEVEIYEAYTRLADRTASLSQTPRADPEPPTTSPTPPPVTRRGTKSVPEPTALISLRADLAKSQSERSDLQTKLDIALRELDVFRSKSKSESTRLTQLTASVSQMTVRLRDRDEELRGKAKLIEDVQDENVTLNLQLNLADDEAKKLRTENQELVDRWMKKMGKEAERMNDESKFE